MNFEQYLDELDRCVKEKFNTDWAKKLKTAYPIMTKFKWFRNMTRNLFLYGAAAAIESMLECDVFECETTEGNKNARVNSKNK